MRISGRGRKRKKKKIFIKQLLGYKFCYKAYNNYINYSHCLDCSLVSDVLEQIHVSSKVAKPIRIAPDLFKQQKLHTSVCSNFQQPIGCRLLLLHVFARKIEKITYLLIFKSIKFNRKKYDKNICTDVYTLNGFQSKNDLSNIIRKSYPFFINNTLNQVITCM